MLVCAKNSRLEKLFSSRSNLVREFGQKRGDTTMRRISELRAATCLADMKLLPGAAFHELQENRSGQFAVNAIYPYRLVLTPVDPIPRTADGRIDLSAVQGVILIEVVNYHGT